jgi:small subunit ribosomal protein S16
MPTVIRMSQTGRTNRPYFRVGVWDLHTRRDGPPVEYLGWYDPLVKDQEKQFKVDAERVAHWFSQGAQVSDTVRSFLKRAKIAVPARKTTRVRRLKDAPRRQAAAARRKAAGAKQKA